MEEILHHQADGCETLKMVGCLPPINWCRISQPIHHILTMLAGYRNTNCPIDIYLYCLNPHPISVGLSPDCIPTIAPIVG